MRALPTFLPSSRSVAERYVDVVLSWNSFLSPVPVSIFIFVVFLRFVQWIAFFRFPERIPVLLDYIYIWFVALLFAWISEFYLSYCFDFYSFD